MSHQKTNGDIGVAARRSAVYLLDQVLGEGRLMSELLGSGVLDRLPAEDRARAQRLALDTLRGLERADRLLQKHLRKQPSLTVQSALRMGTVELCQGGAAHGVVNAMVQIIGADKRNGQLKGLVNAVLRKIAAEGPEAWGKLREPRLPKWLRRPLVEAWGSEAVAGMEAAHFSGAPLDITPKSQTDSVLKTLGAEILPTGTLRLHNAGQVTALAGYDRGDWWVQDVAATFPVHLMGNIAGKNVLDLCAAPGGKTAQLIAAGANVTAVEQSKPRAQRLIGNLERLGMNASLVTTDLFEWETSMLFDAVLLDAPCSSTGTIRRHPDVQWTKTEQSVTELASLQLRMIDHAAQFVAPGGQLIFSNCSLLREEGEQIVASLNRSSEHLTINPITAEDLFGLQDCITGQGTVRTLPIHLPIAELDIPKTLVEEEDDLHRLGGLDGFFAARFIKTDVSDRPASSSGDKLS